MTAFQDTAFPVFKWVCFFVSLKQKYQCILGHRDGYLVEGFNADLVMLRCGIIIFALVALL